MILKIHMKKELTMMLQQKKKKQWPLMVLPLMKLIINSLYKNKDIFLREIISNASDALDKIRLLSLTDKSALSATDELSIKIKIDKDNNCIHVTDTGLGMTREHLQRNSGTIAKSGTSEFFEKM